MPAFAPDLPDMGDQLDGKMTLCIVTLASGQSGADMVPRRLLGWRSAGCILRRCRPGSITQLTRPRVLRCAIGALGYRTHAHPKSCR